MDRQSERFYHIFFVQREVIAGIVALFKNLYSLELKMLVFKRLDFLSGRFLKASNSDSMRVF
jgi:hypothetical protein